MSTRREVVACLALVAALLPTAGCTSILKHAYYEVRGATGTIQFIETPSATARVSWKSVHFEPATTSLGPKICPAELLAEYDRAARRLGGELKTVYPGGEPTLTISNDILYFTKKGLFGDAMLLSRMKLVADGQQVGDALVVVGSKAFREGDAPALVDAALKTIGRYLKEGAVPEEGREARQTDR